MSRQTAIEIQTSGRGMVNITGEVQRTITAGASGLAHIFLHHTSASLLIMENADPDVLVDLETHISGLVQDGDPRFRHTAEGPDDMSAHVRSALTHTDLSVPVTDGRLDLGTWQGIFLWEHRHRPHRRRLTVSIL